MRQMQGVQHQLGGLIQGVVKTVAESQTSAAECARSVTDEIDDAGQFGGHGHSGAIQYPYYSPRGYNSG
jgi:hypothetical protein